MLQFFLINTKNLNILYGLPKCEKIVLSKNSDKSANNP